MDDLIILKKRLRESESKFFEDDELQMYLGESRSLDEATYKCLIVKAQNSSITLSGLTTADTSKYFLRLAALYRPSGTHTL